MKRKLADRAGGHTPSLALEFHLAQQRRMDHLDHGILEVLQADCKTPLAKIGEKVGLSAAAVIERVRKLEDARIILGYHAQVDGRKVGLEVTAFVGVTVNYSKVVGSLEGQLAKVPEILEMHHITGDHSLLLKVKVESPAMLEALLARMRTVSGIERTHTMIALSSPIERSTIAVDPHKRNLSMAGSVKEKRSRASVDDGAD